MQFTESLKFTHTPDEVWKRASDVEAIPRFWHGTKSIQIVEKKPTGSLDVSVRFAFGGVGKAEVAVDNENRVMTLAYYSGPFIGTQKINVKDQQITASWNVKFTGLFKLVSGWNERHFRSGTVHALERLGSVKTE
ncbi:MAG TPA: SRPBCC family protein [Candidatus Bathyarchaeia archaeon]|nr:SRPBCC family protein [Candidatus Bathyarchaeia archaeon]